MRYRWERGTVVGTLYAIPMGEGTAGGTVYTILMGEGTAGGTVYTIDCGLGIHCSTCGLCFAVYRPFLIIQFPW